MLARRICNSSFMAVKAARIQSQVRLLNVSAIALREEKPVMDQGAKQFNNDLKKDKPQSNMTMYYVGGAVVAVGAAYLIMKNTGMIGKKVEDTKDTVAGAYLTHKANQEFEKYKDIIVKVAKEIGGKDLADKVSKVIDEAKDAVTKMAGDMNVSQTAGKAYRQGKDAIQTISEGGISKYIGEFDNVKDMVVKEAKKLGGDDLAKKAGKIFDEAKDKMSKLKDVKDLEGVKDYILKETKKVGGDDLVKQATKYLDEAKNTVQNVAGAIGQHGFGDAEYEKVKDFVVKEAKQIGGDELAKKAAKLMDEAKETIQKIAKEFSQHGDLSDKAGKAYQHVKDQVKKA